MENFQNYFDFVITNPYDQIIKTFGEMIRIDNDDISIGGNTISMEYFRTVGIPKFVNPYLEDIAIAFNVVSSPLTNVQHVFEKHHLQPPLDLQQNLCLDFYPPNHEKNKPGEFMFVDLEDYGSIKIYTMYQQPKTLFVNSSIQQFFMSLTLYVNRRQCLLQNDRYTDSNSISVLNENFYKALWMIDKRAVPSNIDNIWISSHETWWTRIYELIIL
ncbi:hypothetical protein FACS189454_02440 [Planctomycetales bacterium]|nr:hypothetical protein FACS189454_02440 [Planctomycetales bacterium]